MSLAYENRETKPKLAGPHVPTADLFRLDGRTIAVTGGAGAMGLTIADSILESGGDVILMDLPASPPREEYDELKALAHRKSTQISYHTLDVTSESAVTVLFNSPTITSARYPLRGLVTCAGISDWGPSLTYSLTRFRHVVDVNVTGNFLCARTAAAEMTRINLPGSIILVASMSGHVTNRGVDTTAYKSSKSAIHQMARSFAAEWGSRPGENPLIRVNTLSPGYIKTAATEKALAERGTREREWAGDNMLNRLSEIDEFRRPLMFLLGDGSSFMTGSDLRVDGGHCA